MMMSQKMNTLNNSIITESSTSSGGQPTNS
jgi:hypothetical protein